MLCDRRRVSRSGPGEPEIVVSADPEALARTAAELIATLLADASPEGGGPTSP